MLFQGKELADVVESDLKQLIDLRRPEDTQLDYKLKLPDNSPRSKVNFLKDIVALANTAGGVVLYGVEERNGVPEALPGLQVDSDEEKLRLANIIRDGTNPRIDGVRFYAIGLSNSNTILAVEVPRSWKGPHAVNYEGHWRFYGRHSNGNYPMDVEQVRSAILGSNQLAEQIRNFRADRLLKIASGEAPIALDDRAKLILHLIPHVAFKPGYGVDLSEYSGFDPYPILL